MKRVCSRGAADVAVAAPATAPDRRRLPLTLDEAIAQGLANSQRLAELAGARRGRRLRGRRAARRALPAGRAAGGLHPHQPRRRVRRSPRPGGRAQVVYPDIPDNYRTRLDLQWPIYTGGRADALERAARAERGAIAQGSRRGPRRPAPGDHPRVLGARDRARGRGACCERSLDARRRARADVRARLDVRADSAQRRLVGRGAGVAPAAARRSRRPASAASPRPISRRLTGNDAAPVDAERRRHRPAAAAPPTAARPPT